MTNKKHLLIVFHSKTGKTNRMAEAVHAGTQDPAIDLGVRFLEAGEADAQDLLWADGIIFGSPENFGYMSGALKDFFDRTFYELEGQVDGKPYCIFIGAGNDGSGALTAIQRICNGYNFKEVQPPVVAQGELDEATLGRCHELGMAMGAGLEAGIF